MIYFDQAATSFPKPKAVVEAMIEAINEYGANPGRSGHRLSRKAAETVFSTRKKLAGLFGLNNPNRVIFFSNATGALNQAIKGFQLNEGDHVISTSYEHNSVRRPLEYLKNKKGIDISYIIPDSNGNINETNFKSEIRESTKLIVVTHGSNLTGAILPLENISTWAKEMQIPLLVDASQTAGILPIHMEKMNIDMVAFPGHKGLLGPQGIGALLVREDIHLEPIFHGGTGSHSELVDQPNVWPDKYESGTLNTPGIAGLLAGIEEVERLSMEEIFNHERKLVNKAMKELIKIEGVTIFGPEEGMDRLGVIPFMIEGIDSIEIATILDQHYDIAVRSGLHCTPLAHEAIGTINTGLVRISFGPTNTEEEIDRFIEAIKEIQAALQ